MFNSFEDSVTTVPSLCFFSFSQQSLTATIPNGELFAESFDQENSDKTIVYYMEEESLIKVELNLSQQ